MFSKERLIIAILEKVKVDIEKNFKDDKIGVNIINDCLHHFCWKLHEKENQNKENSLNG